MKTITISAGSPISTHFASCKINFQIISREVKKQEIKRLYSLILNSLPLGNQVDRDRVQRKLHMELQKVD